MTPPEADTIRIGRIEAVQEQQQSTLDRLLVMVEKQGRDSKDSIEALRGEVAKIGKTSWPLVVTIIALIVSSTLGVMTLGVTIGVLALTPISNKLDAHIAMKGHPETREAITNLQGRMNENEHELSIMWNEPIAGHFEMARWKGEINQRFASVYARLSDLAEEDADLDEILQREMRLLDEVLQREIALNGQILTERVQRNTDAIEQIRASRFTADRGAAIEDRVRVIDEKQKQGEAP